MESLTLQPIGFIESCYPDKFGVPRQSGLVPQAVAKIRFNPQVQPAQALSGLEDFTHLWVLFWFHQNQSDRYHAKVHPPRLGGESLGVFATRSPHRPNPLGLSLVRVLKVESDHLWIGGIDMVEGTPVLDIKPYLPETEAVTEARGGWCAQVETAQVEVEWNLQLLEQLELWQKEKDFRDLRGLIDETLRLDPRPVIYRGFEGQESKYRQQHAVRFYDGDVHFEFVTPTKIKILRILRGEFAKNTGFANP